MDIGKTDSRVYVIVSGCWASHLTELIVEWIYMHNNLSKGQGAYRPGGL
jgi:hypothetical protein